MGKNDTATKQLIRNKERFADLFNGTIFHGNQVILPQDLEPTESESDILITDKNGITKPVQRFRDIVMLWKNKIALAVMTCEIQNKVHYLMPVRNMLYDSLGYIEQAKQLWEEHSHKDHPPSSEEYLSHFYKDDFLIPIITLVFYYGENEYDGAIDLYGLFPPEFQINNNNLLKKHISNYQINLLDANRIENINLFQSDLQQILGMLQYRKDKRALQHYIKQNKTYFSNIDIDTCYALAELLNSRELKEKAQSKSCGKETINMCQALEEWYQDGINEGWAQGLSQGLAQGLCRGVIETAQDFGLSKEDTILKIMNKFNLEYIDAQERVDTYWTV